MTPVNCQKAENCPAITGPWTRKLNGLHVYMATDQYVTASS